MPTSARVVAGGERRGGERDPAPRAPVAGPAQLGEPVGAAAGHRPSSRPRPAPRRPPPARRAAAPRPRRRAAQPAPGDEQRAQHRGAAVAGERADRGARRPRVRVEHAAQLAVGSRAGQLRVAQHERAEVGAARLRLRAEHLDERERLRRRAGQQPVDVRRAAADPRARELEAEVAQRGGHRLAARRRRGRRRRRPGSAAPSPRAARPSRRGRAAGGRPRRAARRAAAAARPSRGSARRRRRARGGGAGSRPTAPRRRRRRARPRAMAQPRHDPLPEVERSGVAHVEQRRDQLAEARLVLVEPALLARRAARSARRAPGRARGARRAPRRASAPGSRPARAARRTARPRRSSARRAASP